VVEEDEAGEDDPDGGDLLQRAHRPVIGFGRAPPHPAGSHADPGDGSLRVKW
jgi:hypothetical protein